MKAGLLLTGNGALAYLTSHAHHIDDDLVRKFEAKGIKKFIAYEVPLEEAKRRYGGHFGHAVMDLHESNELKVLDYQGARAFSMFKFSEMGEPFRYEAQ